MKSIVRCSFAFSPLSLRYRFSVTARRPVGRAPRGCDTAIITSCAVSLTRNVSRNGSDGINLNFYIDFLFLPWYNMYNIYPYISRKRSMRFMQLVGALIPNNELPASIRIYTAGYVPFFVRFSLMSIGCQIQGSFAPFSGALAE